MAVESHTSDYGNVQDDLDTLKNDLTDLREDFAVLMRNAVGTGRGRLEELRERIQGQMSEQVARLGTMGSRTASSIQHQLEDHPIITLGSVFGLGFILGALMRNT